MLKRLSIGQKIVGLSVALLLLMLAASGYSWLESRRARDAEADFTATLSPVATQVAAIKTHALEQALILERAVRHLAAEDANRGQAETEIARFRSLQSDVDSRLAAAETLVEIGIERAHTKDDAVELARIEPDISRLREEHTTYTNAGLGLYEAALQEARRRSPVADAGADERRVAPLGEQVTAEEERVNHALERLDTKLASATEAEAGRAAATEARAHLVSAESLVLALAAFFTGAIVSAVVSRRMVRPVRALITGAEQVSSGNLDVNLELSGLDEIGQLSRAFQHMIGELRAKERMKSTFGKYMDPRVVERLLLGGGESDIAAGEKRVMTVFFSDLEGFSDISESLTAAGLVNLINHYLTLASEPIVQEHGVIDKYIGDAVMAFWGPPFYEAPDHARRACLAALAQQEQLVELQRMLPDILGIRRNLPRLRARIGLCTGELIVGSIGSHVSKSFTVMGDTVNTASRLEGANKQYGTHILIDGATEALVRDSMETRELDYIGVVGKSEPVRVYELLGERGKVEAPELARRDAFEAALASYRTCAWDVASERFHSVLGLAPDDKAARVFLDRVQQFRETPPDPGWDGVWRLTSK